jgi:hypothetical protein
MRVLKKSLLAWVACCVIVAMTTQTIFGQSTQKPTPKVAPPRVVSRILWEDHSDQTVKWANVSINAQKQVTLSDAQEIAGFKKLDAEKQKLVQIQSSQGLVAVGVRDEEDGEHESGWMVIDSGVRHQDHGDHGHWLYKDNPKVIDSRLDQEQGNPAHVYCYDGRFFLANDRKNGYTRIDPADYLAKTPIPKASFFPGGGNHITLAVANNKVGYSAWIDGGGPNKGRVDVTLLTANPPAEPNYRFHLASGVIHGAATAEGKVFFGPSDGIDWVEVDESASLKPEQIKIHHISLGEHAGKPRRVGAFVQQRRYLLCVTGKGADSKLVILNAASKAPEPQFVPLNVKEGSKATTPRIVIAADKKPYALIFHDHEEESENEDQLDLFALDPNGDEDLSDAAFLKSIPVGQSEVEGHFGHHSVAFDAHGRYAFITNPGDGSLQIIATGNWSEIAKFQLSGKPTDIVAVGGR